MEDIKENATSKPDLLYINESQICDVKLPRDREERDKLPCGFSNVPMGELCTTLDALDDMKVIAGTARPDLSADDDKWCRVYDALSKVQTAYASLHWKLNNKLWNETQTPEAERCQRLLKEMNDGIKTLNVELICDYL